MSNETIIESDPLSVTGNPARDAMLRHAIEKAGPDVAAVQAALPSNFDTDLAEINLMLEAMGLPKIEGEPAEPVEAIEPPTLSLVEAQRALADWQHKTQLARRALRECEMAQRATRSKLVESINFFLRGGPLTPEQMKREYLASEQQKRINGESRRGRVAHGPSVVDIGRAGQSSVNRNYAPKRRPDMMTGRRTYSIADSVARSGSGIIDRPGIVAVPRVGNE